MTNSEKVRLLPPEVVDQISHETEAVVESWRDRTIRFSQREACSELGIDKGNFTRMLDEQIAVPKNKRCDFMRITGNLLPLQHEAARFGCVVIPRLELEKLKGQSAFPTVSWHG